MPAGILMISCELLIDPAVITICSDLKYTFCNPNPNTFGFIKIVPDQFSAKILGTNVTKDMKIG